MRIKTHRSIVGPAIVAAGLLFTGCDSDSTVSGPGNTDGDRTVSGFVTDDAAAGKSAGTIEGAVVTAAELNAQGSLSQAEGDATTDASGRFVLETSADSDLMVVTATKGDFESSILVDAAGSSSTETPAMTSETYAEAEVYVEARRQNEEEVTAADVAAFVDAEIAARIRSGSETAARVAVAIANSAEAEEEYAEENEGFDDEDFDRAKEEDERTYRDYQSSMRGQVSASAAVNARVALERAVARAHATAGASATAQAKARGASKTAMESFTANMDATVRFHLRKKAELMSAIASGAAIEAEFQAEGSSQTSTVSQAAASLEAQVRSAGSESEIEAAWDEFRSDIKAAVAAELSVSSTLVDAAITSANSVEAKLVADLLIATTVDALVDAKAAYYSAAESTMAAALSTSAKASFGAKVLVLASGS